MPPSSVLGFWDVDNIEDKRQGVRAFKVHSMPVNCLTFDKFNPTRLLSTSYDGYVRCLDFNSDKIDKVLYFLLMVGLFHISESTLTFLPFLSGVLCTEDKRHMDGISCSERSINNSCFTR